MCNPSISTKPYLFILPVLNTSAGLCVERRGNYAVAVTTGGTISLHDVAAIRGVASLATPPPGIAPITTTMKRTAPKDISRLDLRALPPPHSSPAPAANAPPATRGRPSARPRSARAGEGSRSSSWGHKRPPLAAPRARARSSEGLPARHRSPSEIVRVRAFPHHPPPCE